MKVDRYKKMFFFVFFFVDKFVKRGRMRGSADFGWWGWQMPAAL
jgi:hypothetical protein